MSGSEFQLTAIISVSCDLLRKWLKKYLSLLFLCGNPYVAAIGLSLLIIM